MSRRVLVKCSRLFYFIVFFMCPKRIHSTSPIIKQQQYFPTLRMMSNVMTSNDVNNVDLKFRHADWSTDIMRQREDESLQVVDAEPGFDLSDDEIRKFKLWPKGIVPYYIDVLSFNDKVLRDRIRLFLNTINSLTRLSFLEMPSPPKDDKTRWVFFVNRRGQLGCFDHSINDFTNEGVQYVNLGYDCISSGGELAEAVLSIAGIPSQHNSPDRDHYIKILYENVIPEKRYLFQKLNDDQWLFHDVKYDWSSAGHFHQHKYSANGRATIEIQDIYAGTSMGENHGFTSSDIKKLRMLYNYIVMKNENKVPECAKLFRKGPNFFEVTGNMPEHKPRKKPNKYLGLPEGEHLEGSDYEDEDKKDKDHKQESKEGSDSTAEDQTSDEEENDNSDYDDKPPSTSKMDPKSHTTGGKQNWG